MEAGPAEAGPYRPRQRGRPEARGAGAQPGTSNPAPRRADAGNHNHGRSRAGDKNANIGKKPKNTKVYVSGFPELTKVQDLYDAFARFGQPRVEKINTRLNYAVVDYKTVREARAAIQASHKIYINGTSLYTRQYNLPENENDNDKKDKRDFSRSKQKSIIIEPKNIDLSGSFHDQVDRILEAVRLTAEEAEAICPLYEDVERVLQTQWPGCVAVPFGSITTGLGIKTSDADCFVDVPAEYLQRMSGGGATLVNRAKRALSAHPDIFTEIISIPRANTPIVKFFHLPTETNCDLSFKTPLGVQNSRLIEFLVDCDSRLLPLALVAKYWVKAHGLSGTGRLTNYALTMMIIFYLQQPHVAILPSIESLQRDPENNYIVDYWNTGFDSARDENMQSTIKSTLPELLGGFFDFYSQFNFDELVVCPYLGRAVKREDFKDLSVLPEEFTRYKENVSSGRVQGMRISSAIVVQDPFEQCHNVACTISPKLAAEIIAYFKFAAAAYEREKEKGCRELLKSILLRKPKIIRANARPEYRITFFPKTVLRIVDDDWKSVVRHLILVVFEDMLKMELRKLESKELNVDGAIKHRERYNGTATKAVWKRKNFAKLYSVIDMEFVEKQARITEEILNVEKENVNLNFNLTLTFVSEPRCASLWMKLMKGDATVFTEFGKFFVGTMSPWFHTLLRSYLGDMPVEDGAMRFAEAIEMMDNNLDNSMDSDGEESANENMDSANNTDNSMGHGEPDNDSDTAADVSEAQDGNHCQSDGDVHN